MRFPVVNIHPHPMPYKLPQTFLRSQEGQSSILIPGGGDDDDDDDDVDDSIIASNNATLLNISVLFI